MQYQQEVCIWSPGCHKKVKYNVQLELCKRVQFPYLHFQISKIKGVYENENNKSLLAEQVQEMFLTGKKMEKLQ